MHRVLLIAPFYVAYMICLNSFFDSAGLNTSNDLPLWLVIAFTMMSVAALCILAWFVSQNIRGKISVKRERFYLGILITVIVAGFIDDALTGLASLVFKSSSIWVMVPLYLISYAALWVVAATVFTKLAKKSDVAVSGNAGSD